MARIRRSWKSVVWKEQQTVGDSLESWTVKLVDKACVPGSPAFARRLEQLAGLLKDGRKAHEDAVHSKTLKKTKRLPFPKRKRLRKLSDIDLDPAGAKKPAGVQQTAEAETAETSS